MKTFEYLLIIMVAFVGINLASTVMAQSTKTRTVSNAIKKGKMIEYTEIETIVNTRKVRTDCNLMDAEIASIQSALNTLQTKLRELQAKKREAKKLKVCTQ